MVWLPDGSSDSDPVPGLSDVIPFPRARDDSIWAVMAEAGRTARIAEVYPSREAALADRDWREAQVKTYAHFLRSVRQPIPRYSIAPIRRADLPRSWTPLPALGFLRGQFV